MLAVINGLSKVNRQILIELSFQFILLQFFDLHLVKIKLVELVVNEEVCVDPSEEIYKLTVCEGGNICQMLDFLDVFSLDLPSITAAKAKDLLELMLLLLAFQLVVLLLNDFLLQISECLKPPRGSLV